MLLEKIIKSGIVALTLLSLSSCCSNEIYISESVNEASHKAKQPEICSFDEGLTYEVDYLK